MTLHGRRTDPRPRICLRSVTPLPFSNLASIGRLELLKAQFSTVWIPDAVANELAAYPTRLPAMLFKMPSGRNRCELRLLRIPACSSFSCCNFTGPRPRPWCLPRTSKQTSSLLTKRKDASLPQEPPWLLPVFWAFCCAPSRLENTCKGPVKSSWVTFGKTTIPI